jgi:hypothetical protein
MRALVSPPPQRGRCRGHGCAAAARPRMAWRARARGAEGRAGAPRARPRPPARAIGRGWPLKDLEPPACTLRAPARAARAICPSSPRAAERRPPPALALAQPACRPPRGAPPCPRPQVLSNIAATLELPKRATKAELQQSIAAHAAAGDAGHSQVGLAGGRGPPHSSHAPRRQLAAARTLPMHATCSMRRMRPGLARASPTCACCASSQPCAAACEDCPLPTDTHPCRDPTLRPRPSAAS